MSWDFTAYARAPKLKRSTLISTAEELAGSKVECDDDTLSLPEGEVHYVLRRFGVELSISSTDGATAALGDAVEELAGRLGPPIEEDEAWELIAQEEADGWEPKAELPKKGSVHVALLDAQGVVLKEVTTTPVLFFKQQLEDGELESFPVSTRVPALLTDEGRMPFPGKRLVCTVFDAAKKQVQRFTYELDAYGRPTHMTED